MANFQPLKRYIFYCVDRLIEQYGLRQPFLDAGCGIGDLSRHVASRGWCGKAIDFSDIALERARQNLESLSQIRVEKKSLFEEAETFQTIFLLDVLEHIENDETALQKIASLLCPNGHAVITVPTNPGEWRWDDDFYGNYRRYTVDEMAQKLTGARLEPIVFWDFTFPIFWIARRLYTRIKYPRNLINKDKLIRTAESSSVDAWSIPLLSDLLQRVSLPWGFLYKIQFAYFKDKLERGHEMIVLGRKTP